MDHSYTMEQKGGFNTFQDNGTHLNIDNISAGLSLAVLVALGTIGNIALLMSVGSALRTVLHRRQRLVHDLAFMYGCLEGLFFFIPCILSTYAYLSSWRVDMYQSVCDFFGWVVFTVKFGSLWIMTIVAIERYVVVCRPSGLSNQLASRMGHTAFGGIVTVTVLAAVPLIVKAGMVTSIAVPNAICHFDFTPRTLNTQAFAITSIVLAYAMFQVTLFCHVSILCHPSRDVPEDKSPIQDGAAEPDRSQHRNHTMIYAFTPLTIWMWMCTLPLLITLIMAQTGYEISSGLEFGVLRTLTVCSALSPYILLSSSVYYRKSFCAFICCRGEWTSDMRTDAENNDVSSVVRCEDCLVNITRLQEHGHRSTTTTIVESRDTINPGSANHKEQDIHQRNYEEVASYGHGDWPEVEVENHTHQIPELNYDGDEHTLARTRGMLPSDSRVYLLSAGENGELVCGGSFDGDSFQGHSQSPSPRGDQETNSSSPILDGYHEEDYYQAENGQAGGYLITLPVNMPGQGSNETVERIFYIREPHKRGLESAEGDNHIQDEDLQVAVSKDKTVKVDSSDVTSPRYDTANSSRSSLSRAVTHEDDTGSDEEMEDEELSRVEAEIRGRIMGRSYRGKMRRSSTPQTMAVQNKGVQMSFDDTSMDIKSMSSDQDSPSLTRQGIREQDIRLHGPSASDPRLVTLAFQQAMLAHSQQYVTQSNKEIDLEHGQSNGIINKNSMGQLIPVINITPAETDLDAMDEIQPIFAQPDRRLDYRFLAPIAEEVGFVGDRSSTRIHNLSSISNTKHEKVHRMPARTSQLMSNWKLQEDVRRSISSTPLIKQNDMQEATESPHDDDTTSIRQNGSDEHRRCPSAVEGGSMNNGCEMVTMNGIAKESSKSVSHMTLEKVGNIIEGTVEGKDRASDPFLESSEWINVEHAMQGNVNHGFVVEGDVSLDSNGLESIDISSQTTIDTQKCYSDVPSSECDSVHNDAEIDPVEGGETEVEKVLNVASEIAIGSSNSTTLSRREDNKKRWSESVASAKDGDIDVTSLKKKLPLERQEKVDDSIGSPTNVFSIQSANNEHTIQNENFTMDNENGVSKIKNLGKVDIAYDGENPKWTHLIENENGANNSGATVELIASHLKGERSGASAYPLTHMRAFPIDGNLYVMYTNKTSKSTNSTMTSEKDEDSRGSENKTNPKKKASLSNGSDSTVEVKALDRRAAFPIQKRVQFMNTVPNREPPHVDIAIV